MDFEAAAKMSGSRFVVLKGQIARLERALGQFMLDLQTGEHGYAECNPPVLVGDDAMYGTDKLPKFAEDSFCTTNGRWLIPTSEVSLTASVMGELLDESRAGLYTCGACDAELFQAGTKFDSGCGWPSFYDAKPGTIDFHEDCSFGMRRVEVTCHRCGSHLGHVFEDGPAPTGQRYCINSVSVELAIADAAGKTPGK